MCFNGLKEVDRRTGNIEHILNFLPQPTTRVSKKAKKKQTNKQKKRESSAFVDVYISRSGYVATNLVHPD